MKMPNQDPDSQPFNKSQLKFLKTKST
jgi:hypothetical protein